jgi:hypothetical protein
MRPWLLAGVAGWCFLASSTSFADPPSAREGPNWLTDLGHAREVARQTGKPIFAVLC